MSERKSSVALGFGKGKLQNSKEEREGRKEEGSKDARMDRRKEDKITCNII